MSQLTSRKVKPRTPKRRKSAPSCGTVSVDFVGSIALVGNLPNAIACQLNAKTHQLRGAEGYRIAVAYEFFCRPRLLSRPGEYALSVGLLHTLIRLVELAGGQIAFPPRLKDLGPTDICELSESAGHATNDVEDAMRYLSRRRVDRSRPACLGEFDAERAERIDARNQEMLTLVSTSNHGLIRYSAGVEPLRLLAQIALAFRGRRIGLVVPLRRDSVRLARLHRNLGIDFFHYYAGWSPAGPRKPRVCVGTPRQLTNSWWWTWDMLVFQDALAALGKTVEIDQVARRVPRMYALLPTSMSVSPGDRQRLRSWFGFDEVTVLAGGRIPPKVEVTWERIVGGPPLSAGSDMKTFVRQAYDTHPIRNRRVIRRAREAAATGSVAILAGSVYHAAILAQRLVDWGVKVGRAADLRGMSPRLVSALQAGLSRPVGDRVIFTPVAVRALDLLQFDTVIRATGGTGVVSELQRSKGIPSQSCRLIQLVDFDDCFDPRAQKLARRRRQAYRDAEWLAPDEDVIDARVDEFLARRP